MISLLLCGVVGFAVGLGASKIKLKRKPINVVNGILLPNPNDERWIRGTSQWGSCPHTCLRLNTIEICTEQYSLRIDSIMVTKAPKYVNAVNQAQLERKALAAMEL